MKLTLIILKEEKDTYDFDMSESKTVKLDKPKKLGNKTITHAKEGVKLKKIPASNMYVGFIPEIPGIHTQGATIDEVKENIKEVVQLMCEQRKEDFLNEIKATHEKFETFEIDL